MTRSALPKLSAYPALAAVALFAAIVLGRPELVSLAVPFALFLAVGLGRLPAPDVTLAFAVRPDRVVEGDEVELAVDATSAAGVDRLELRPSLPERLEWSGPPPAVFRLEPGEERAFTLPFRSTRFGAYRVGGCEVRAFDSFGLVVDSETVEPELALRVYPEAERLKRLIDPVETQPYAGNQVARAKGEGIEFADIRPFAPGDRVHRINWRASARLRALQVNESHPERNADVVLFLDSFTDTGDATGGTIDLTVRAAAALARAYLRTRDRVGIVGFGGVLRWVLPSAGTTQTYRILDSLIDTQVVASYAWRDVAVIPGRTLPPNALVLALSPLSDARMRTALVDLRARGVDLAVIDVSPLPFVGKPRGDLGDLAWRVWRLQREQLGSQYRAMGVPVVEWGSDRSVDEVLAQIREVRRYARTVRI